MIVLKSHGFKFSRPEANIVFDVSYFTNPWREKHIREDKDSESRKEKIIRFMGAQEGVREFAKGIATIIMQYERLFPDENVQVAICCSAGEFRSPAIVELIGKMLPTGFPFIIKHSENSKI